MEQHDFERNCPSFYAEAPKGDVSDEYVFLNTREIALQLWDSGWMPVHATEQRSNDITNRGFTKHIVRWAHPEFVHEGERVELVGMNSHNRSAAFQLMLGVEVFACLNGQIVADQEFGHFSIKHIGTSVESQVKYALKEMMEIGEGIGSKVETWKALHMNGQDQHKLARAAHIMVWGNNAPVDAARLLWPRRMEEEGWHHKVPRPNLWTTMNVIQENVMKGGLRGTNSAGAFHRTRPITAIDRGVKFNQSLWQMSEIMATQLAA